MSLHCQNIHEMVTLPILCHYLECLIEQVDMELEMETAHTLHDKMEALLLHCIISVVLVAAKFFPCQVDVWR